MKTQCGLIVSVVCGGTGATLNRERGILSLFPIKGGGTKETGRSSRSWTSYTCSSGFSRDVEREWSKNDQNEKDQRTQLPKEARASPTRLRTLLTKKILSILTYHSLNGSSKVYYHF